MWCLSSCTFLAETGSKMTVCMSARPPSTDFLPPPPPSPPLHFPHLLTPTAPFTDSAERSQFVCVCDPKLCLHVRNVWICMCVCIQNGCCASVCELKVWRPYLWLCLPAAFAGLWSWVWGMRNDLWTDSSICPPPPLRSLRSPQDAAGPWAHPSSSGIVNKPPLPTLPHTSKIHLSLFPFSYQSNSSSRIMSLSPCCWFVWQVVNSSGE